MYNTAIFVNKCFFTLKCGCCNVNVVRVWYRPIRENKKQQDKMTTAQIYSNNIIQFQRCGQGLHEVARHVASWLQACGLVGVP